MARASRSKIIKKYNPELQEEFKQRAEKAWNWLESTTQT
jgi:lysyl-tRNA synthetase class I